MQLSGAIVGGLSLGLFMAISVGPTLFAIIRYSLNHSYKAGIAFVLGVSVSDIMYVTIANMATPWLQWFHRYARELSYTAAVVLVIAGLAGLLKKYKPQRPSPKSLAINKSKYFRIWGSGFLINTLNPALILQWLLAATATAAESGFYRFVFFACCLGLVLGVDVLKVILADTIRRRLTLRKVMYLQRFSAFCLLLFGIGIFILTILNIELKNPAEKQSTHQQFQSATVRNFAKA